MLAPTSEPDRVDSYATDAGVLWARTFSGAASTFELFDGARLAQEERADGVFLASVPGDEFAQGAVVELLAFGERPPGVDVDGSAAGLAPDVETLAAGEAAGWAWDESQGGRVFVRLPAGEHEALVRR